MLDIFFTNKIPSSSFAWTDELIRVASIFNAFNGLAYNRDAIIDRFETVSNRVPGARDVADYRDEYGAYASFLGLMHYQQAGDRWICRVNRHVQELLCGVLPDPQSFVRLQMSLFQYPNPFGAVYHENGILRIEPLSQAKRMEQVRTGVRTVPFRLFLRVLLALHDEFGSEEAYLTYPEIWHRLFTQREAVGTFDPDGLVLARQVMRFRARPVDDFPQGTLRNLHILKHTGLISKPGANTIRLASQAGNHNSELGQVARTVAAMTSVFSVPRKDANEEAVLDWARGSLETGAWASYYSGSELTVAILDRLVETFVEVEPDLLNDESFGPGAPLLDFARERATRTQRMGTRPASREETEALREKANLSHRTLVNLLADRLRSQDLTPKSNIFVDLCCEETQKLLFEVKSCRAENLLSQVRKGVSQLYEYRYRHEALQDAKLVLALESKPTGELEWLVNYLVQDREIDICWLEGEDNLACPSYCQASLGNLVNRIEHMP